MGTKLKERQKRFVDEYLIDLNATQAAIRAGYSPKTAYSIGDENLKKPEIQEYISERMKDREKRTEITQDKVLKELADASEPSWSDSIRGALSLDDTAQTIADQKRIAKELATVTGPRILQEAESSGNLLRLQPLAQAAMKIAPMVSGGFIKTYVTYLTFVWEGTKTVAVGTAKDLATLAKDVKAFAEKPNANLIALAVIASLAAGGFVLWKLK